MLAPLRGVRVVEFVGLGPAPFAARMLVRLGASVVRIDRLIDGPVGVDGATDRHLGGSVLRVDLKSSTGVESALKEIAKSQILIEGFRPGTMESFGLGPEDCWQTNPGLVYGRVTGWGQSGPLANRPGHDINFLAVSGALHAMGAAGGPPIVPLNIVSNFGAGAAHLVIGILAGLREADGTGQGCVVDAAGVDGVSDMLALVYSLLDQGTWRDERGVNLLDGGAPFYSVYETADGKHVAVGALEPKFFDALIKTLGVDLPSDAQSDRDEWPNLRVKLASLFRQRTRDEWEVIFKEVPACVTPVLSLEEARRHPHLLARRPQRDTDSAQPALITTRSSIRS